jgi:hypothetical protein
MEFGEGLGGGRKEGWGKLELAIREGEERTDPPPLGSAIEKQLRTALAN